MPSCYSRLTIVVVDRPIADIANFPRGIQAPFKHIALLSSAICERYSFALGAREHARHLLGGAVWDRLHAMHDFSKRHARNRGGLFDYAKVVGMDSGHIVLSVECIAFQQYGKIV